MLEPFVKGRYNNHICYISCKYCTHIRDERGRKTYVT